MNYQTLLFDKRDNYGIITLNRPDKLNALNFQLFSELDDLIQKIEMDNSIKIVVLTGSGEKAFAAGADIMELNQSDNPRAGKLFSEFGSKVMLRLEQLRIPVIAAINGFALGGGLELAMACHIRFSSDKAKLGQPEVNLGIIPGYGATQRLPRLVGKPKALELIISGNTINAQSAKEIGLINEIFPHEDLMEKTLAFVQLVLTKAPLAVSAAVDTIMSSDILSLQDGLTFESRIFGDICGTEDFKEGTKAFLEKRQVIFTGK